MSKRAQDLRGDSLSAEDLDYIVIEDFSPGIVQKLNSFSLSGASPSQLGAARLESTFRCVALPNGGLGPLPKRYYDYSRAALGNAATRTVTGFNLTGPFSANPTSLQTTDITDPSTHPIEVYLGYGYETGGNKFENIEAIRLWNATLLQLNADTGGAINGKFGPVYISPFRHNNTVPASLGNPKVAFSWIRAADAAPVTNIHKWFPNSTAASPYMADFSALYSGLMEAHQSRIISPYRSAYNLGNIPTATYMPHTETIAFTDPNTTTYGGTNILDIGPESPYSFGCLSSLSASDLLMIKHQGGGYLLQGDISYPIVRHLPGIQSTGGIECNGINSSLGFVYGVNNGGVYLWPGGESTIQLSPQLEDNFWIPSSSSALVRYKGRFAQWKNYILCPNNYLFDIETKGWWRLEDESVYVYGMFAVSPVNNVLYGSRTTFSDASPVAFSGWSPKEPASSYSWQSQPIPLTISRRVEVREIHIIAQGTGTITVTLSNSLAGSASDVTVTFTLPSDAATKPYLLRRRLTWEGTQLMVKLVASHTSTGAAPVIYSFRAGHRTGSLVAETTS